MMYFSSIGCTTNIATNPAEFLIDLAKGNTNDKTLPTKLEDEEPSTVDVHEYLVEVNQDRLTKMDNKRLLTTIMIDHGEYQMQGWSYSLPMVWRVLCISKGLLSPNIRGLL